MNSYNSETTRARATKFGDTLSYICTLINNVLDFHHALFNPLNEIPKLKLIVNPGIYSLSGISTEHKGHLGQRAWAMGNFVFGRGRGGQRGGMLWMVRVDLDLGVYEMFKLSWISSAPDH